MTAEHDGTAGSAEAPVEVLRGYALIADGERGALIGPRGDLSWLCVPQWHDDAVFSSLIGGRGRFLLTPTAERFVWGGSYQSGSLIWRGRWVSDEGVIETQEALAMPADRQTAVLLRRVLATEGTARVQVVLDARAGFGRHRMGRLHRDEDGTWTARTGDLRIRLRGAQAAEIDADGRLTLALAVPQGAHHDLVLELSAAALPEPTSAEELWERTTYVWSTVVPDLMHTAAPRDSAFACALLRGMTSTSGGMVAAATMSLPERSEGRRNYDYRYVWLRDLSYAGYAAAAAGMQPLLAELVGFAVERVLESGGQVRPASRVDGGPVPDERELPLVGYPGGRDIAGNWVNTQFQLDTMGELLQLFTVAARYDCLDSDGWKAMRLTTSVIADRWQEPEAGIWELADDWWAHSRLACCAGLRAAASVQSAHDAAGLVSLADEIVTETSRRCLHPDGRWQRSPTLTGTDAALVFPPTRGALPADDPRTRATLAAVKRNLVEDYYSYRYVHDDLRLGDAEGAFLLCGFMISLAELTQNNRVEAFRWFERNRAACGSPGLFTEEYDVRQRQLRGNIPQAFVHAAMLECSVRLAG